MILGADSRFDSKNLRPLITAQTSTCCSQESLTQQVSVVKEKLAKAQQQAQPFIDATQKIQEKLVEVQKKREKMGKQLGQQKPKVFQLQPVFCLGGR